MIYVERLGITVVLRTGFTSFCTHTQGKSQTGAVPALSCYSLNIFLPSVVHITENLKDAHKIRNIKSALQVFA